MSCNKELPKHWAMLAVNIDELDDPRHDIAWPCLGQPKLNGVRACWTGEKLISRQNKLFKQAALPELYQALIHWSAFNPGIILDGELYSHELPFQEICARVAINRTAPHPDADSIKFHAFDIISQEHTEARLTLLSMTYKDFVPAAKLTHPDQIEPVTNRFYEAGFEGLMIRQLNTPYYHSRTNALIKVKPWKHTTAVIVDFKEGLGKYKDSLGALLVALPNKQTCWVSGGLTDDQRRHIWSNKPQYQTHRIKLAFRELSLADKPLKPQIVSL